MRVLIVEDELALAEALKTILEEESYTVDVKNDGRAGLEQALTVPYDVLILDVMLPYLDGFSIIKELRQRTISTPTLLLTAKSTIRDKVQRLDTGADYYLTKPYNSEELLACVRAISRRNEAAGTDELLGYGDLTLDLGSYVLRCGGQSIHLSLKEFTIMQLLLGNPKAIITKETLIIKAWGMDSDAADNNVEVYISFIRKKLFYLKSRVNIVSQRKVGYFLEYEGLCDHA